MKTHFIALEWSKANMVIARMTEKSNEVKVVESLPDIAELKLYLSSLKGDKIFTFEESTPAQWLYTELMPYVDRIIVCDPYRNRLLSEGPKTDKTDARKLVRLLQAGLLKEVYHSGESFIKIRKLASGYEDIVKAGVRLKNQRSALLRSMAAKDDSRCKSIEKFVLKSIDRGIDLYEEEKGRFEEEFKKLSRKHKMIRLQKSIPGIGDINAVKIVARVVDPSRISTDGDYHLLCGLLKWDKISGGRSYGRRQPRYCRQLKCVYKTAAVVVIGKNNPFNDYYEYLMKEKGYPEYQARHAVSRRIASISYGVLKTGQKYDPYRREKCKGDQN
jgi:hypothetical protein